MAGGSSERRCANMNRVLEIVLVIVLFGSALAFGGVQPLAYSAFEIALFVALPVLVLKQALEGRVSLDCPIWPVLFVLVVVFQLIPLQHGRTLSIYPHDTAIGLLKILAYLCAFILAARLFDSRKRKSLLVSALIALGCFEAVYGIFQYLTGWQKIFWVTKVFDAGQATGTYINRNHFAGLLELTIPFVIASLFYSFQRWAESRIHGPGIVSQDGGSSSGGKAFIYMLVLLVMVLAVVFSYSRMGILSTIFVIMVLVLLAQLRSRQKIWALGLFVFLICVLGYALWIGLGPVLGRFEAIQTPGYFKSEARLSFLTDTLRLLRQSPWFGTGLGTFEDSFRRYQSSMLEFTVEHAHNDYAEFAAETGLVGAALFFLPIFYLLGKMIISFLDDPRRYRRAITLGCIGSTLAILIHSFVDFNLQIPANALIFATVLGIGYKAVLVERRGEEQGVGPALGLGIKLQIPDSR